MTFLDAGHPVQAGVAFGVSEKVAAGVAVLKRLENHDLSRKMRISDG